MNTNIECGGCTQRLSLEHWKECRNVQCKCQHYKRHHGKYGDDCKKRGSFIARGYCRCPGFEPLLTFDEFWGWSKSVKPEILYTKAGLKTGVPL